MAVRSGKDLLIQIQNDLTKQDLDDQVYRRPSDKMSPIVGYSAETIAQLKQERVNETKSELALQIKLQTAMQNRNVMKALFDDRIVSNTAQDEHKRYQKQVLERRADTKSKLSNSLAQQVAQKNQAKQLGLLQMKIN